MLSTKVRSTQELISIALQAERQTTRRYTQLAADMREAGNLSNMHGMHGDTHSPEATNQTSRSPIIF